MFPLHLWDKIISQAVITLNLLRPPRINPKLSAYAQLHGSFVHYRTPLAPPGIKLLVHVTPDAWNAMPIDGTDNVKSIPAIGRLLRFPMDITIAELSTPINDVAQPTVRLEEMLFLTLN